MDLQVLVIILGALAIVAFIVHGFVMGRVDRRPLVRDRMAESNAKAKTPTSNDMGQVQGSVKIIDKDVINVDNKEFIDNAEDVVLSKDDADKKILLKTNSRISIAWKLLIHRLTRKLSQIQNKRLIMICQIIIP